MSQVDTKSTTAIRQWFSASTWLLGVGSGILGSALGAILQTAFPILSPSAASATGFGVALGVVFIAIGAIEFARE